MAWVHHMLFGVVFALAVAVLTTLVVQVVWWLDWKRIRSMALKNGQGKWQVTLRTLKIVAPAIWGIMTIEAAQGDLIARGWTKGQLEGLRAVIVFGVPLIALLPFLLRKGPPKA